MIQEHLVRGGDRYLAYTDGMGIRRNRTRPVASLIEGHSRMGERAFVKLIERLLLQVTVVQESYQNLRPAPTRGRGVRHSGFSAAHGMDIYKEYLSAK